MEWWSVLQMLFHPAWQKESLAKKEFTARQCWCYLGQVYDVYVVSQEEVHNAAAVLLHNNGDNVLKTPFPEFIGDSVTYDRCM